MMPMVPKEDVSPTPSTEQINRLLNAFIISTGPAAPMMRETLARRDRNDGFSIVTFVQMFADGTLPGDAEKARNLLFHLAIYGAGEAIIAE